MLALMAEAAPEEAAAEPLKSNFVMCRLNDDDLNALDTLVEAGVRTTRSDAAAWLRAGIQANDPLFNSVPDKVAQIRQALYAMSCYPSFPMACWRQQRCR